jgi:hypothetical protein
MGQLLCKIEKKEVIDLLQARNGGVLLAEYQVSKTKKSRGQVSIM